MRVRIRYVDGEEVAAHVAQWSMLRADGIDEVWVGDPHETAMGGHSLYWLYREGDAWVMGCGSLYPNSLPPEVLFYTDGRQASRPIMGMPDLRHHDVKLGHWRPGEGRPCPRPTSYETPTLI